MSIANRKSHNYALATNIPYSVELAKLMNLIINGTQRKMYLAIFKLINNLTI